MAKAKILNSNVYVEGSVVELYGKTYIVPSYAKIIDGNKIIGAVEVQENTMIL